MMQLPGAVSSRTSTKDCECEKEKKKERKPRQPRRECWKGSYVETAFGLRKQRRELVPC